MKTKDMFLIMIATMVAFVVACYVFIFAVIWEIGKYLVNHHKQKKLEDKKLIMEFRNAKR